MKYEIRADAATKRRIMKAVYIVLMILAVLLALTIIKCTAAERKVTLIKNLTVIETDEREIADMCRGNKDGCTKEWNFKIDGYPVFTIWKKRVTSKDDVKGLLISGHEFTHVLEGKYHD